MAAVRLGTALAAVALTALVAAPGPLVHAQGENTTLAIFAPADDETVYDNTGFVPVRVAVEGRDATDAATLRLSLDGVPTASAEPAGAGTFNLTGIERGSHMLQAELLDTAGRVIAQSPAVVFHMWQASALFPGRGRK